MTTTNVRDYLDHAQKEQEAVASLLSRMVAVKSLSRQEGDVVELLRREMLEHGYDDVRVDGLGNLIGRIGNGPLTMALDGHCDTVDVGDGTLWDTDPWKPEIRDGWLHGLGACDQKGGLAAAVYGAALLKRLGVPDNLSLLVVASTQEEDCEGLCWQYLVNEEGLRPDIVVLTEPTDLGVYRGQRGRMEVQIATSGVACHGSAPDRGENAIYKMAPIVSEIEALNERLEPREPLGPGSVVVSHICSRAPSLCAVPDSCVIHLDRRLTAGETDQTVLDELKALDSVRRAGAELCFPEYEEKAYTGLSYSSGTYFPPWNDDATAPHIALARKAYTALFGAEAREGHWCFSTNGVATAGLFNISSVGFGPGQERFAHAPNERIELDQVVKAAAFYAAYAAIFARGNT